MIDLQDDDYWSYWSYGHVIQGEDPPWIKFWDTERGTGNRKRRALPQKEARSSSNHYFSGANKLLIFGGVATGYFTWNSYVFFPLKEKTSPKSQNLPINNIMYETL